MSADDQAADAEEEDTVGIDVDADDLPTGFEDDGEDATDETNDADTDVEDDSDSEVNDEDRVARYRDAMSGEATVERKMRALLLGADNDEDGPVLSDLKRARDPIELTDVCGDAVTVIDEVAAKLNRGSVAAAVETRLTPLSKQAGIGVDELTSELVEPVKPDVDADDVDAAVDDVASDPELTQINPGHVTYDALLEDRLLRVEQSQTTDHATDPVDTWVIATEPVDADDPADVDPADVPTRRIDIDPDNQPHLAQNTLDRVLTDLKADIDSVIRARTLIVDDDIERIIDGLIDQLDGDDVDLGSPSDPESPIGLAIGMSSPGPETRPWTEGNHRWCVKELVRDRLVEQPPTAGPRTDAWESISATIEDRQVTSSRSDAVEHQHPYYSDEEDEEDVWVPRSIIDAIIDELPVTRRELQDELTERGVDSGELPGNKLSTPLADGERAWRFDASHDDVPDVDPETVSESLTDSTADKLFPADTDADEQGGEA